MTLRFAVLGIIAQKPSTGFELLREFEAVESVIWPAPQNEVYRVLRGLKNDGLAEIVAEGPRGSRTYGATEAGREALATWILAPSDYTLRYEPILKAHFLDQVDSETRLSRAQQDLAFFESQLVLIRRRMRERPPGAPDRREEARAMAASFYEALAGWARAIIEQSGTGNES
ncbi:MAG: PadR family transcriptional regulator [Amphiplicatus sp.]